MTIQYKIFRYDDPIPNDYINSIINMNYNLDIICTKYLNINKEYNINKEFKKETIQSFIVDKDYKKKTFILAIDNNIVIGMIGFYYNYNILTSPSKYYDIYAKNSYVISQFYVNEKYRRHGIGTILFKIVEEIISSNKSNKIIQLTTQEFNPAVKLYERINYKLLYRVMMLNLEKYILDDIYDENIMNFQIIHYIDSRLNKLIFNSLKEHQNYFNNQYNTSSILNFIKMMMKNRKLIIFQYENICFVLDDSNQYNINILDIIFDTNDDSKLFKALNSLINYCINNKKKEIYYIYNMNNKDVQLFRNFDFRDKIRYYGKIFTQKKYSI